MYIEKSGEGYHLYRIPGIIRTDDGGILCYYECRAQSADWGDINVKVVRSEDGGKSFTEVERVIHGKETVNNPVMIADGRTVHFLYNVNYRELMYKRSDDFGRTFSPEVRLTDVINSAPFPFTVAAVGPGHGIKHGGALITPIWFAYDESDPKSHHPSFIATLYSTDGGESWHVGQRLETEDIKDASECALAELPTGDILISIRNECPEKRRAFAVSKSGYSDWSRPTLYGNMPDPTCMAGMTSHRGTAYHLGCASTTAREELTLKISRDGFKTYSETLIDRFGGYSDIAVCDGAIYMLYEHKLHENGGLIFRSMPIPE